MYVLYMVLVEVLFIKHTERRCSHSLQLTPTVPLMTHTHRVRNVNVVCVIYVRAGTKLLFAKQQVSLKSSVKYEDDQVQSKVVLSD